MVPQSISVSVLLVSLLSLFSSASASASEENATCTSCNATHTPEEIRKLRLEQLKQNILAQMGYTEPPTVPADAGLPPALDGNILDDFEELTAAAATSEERCISGDFYAKPINSFIGVLSPAEGKAMMYAGFLFQRPWIGTKRSRVPRKVAWTAAACCKEQELA